MAEGAISDRLVNIMKLFVGRFTGGLAMASVMACMFFAAISGSSPATVIAIGSIMMPALIKEGYSERFSIGLLTSAGSLGILIPPSIPMILYALVMNVSVAEIFMAGFLPGIFIGCCLMGYSYFVSDKHGWRSEVKYSFRDGVKIIKDGLWAIFSSLSCVGGDIRGRFHTYGSSGRIGGLRTLRGAVHLQGIEDRKAFCDLPRLGHPFRLSSFYYLLRYVFHLAFDS